MEGHHADALYNLAIAELELIYDICDDEDSDDATTHAYLAKGLSHLTSVIAKDTSNRGETTGLSHRIIANVLCRYYKAMMTVNADGSSSFEHLVDIIKTHVTASMTMLANHPELDSLLFENCQLLNGMLSSYMEDNGSGLSKLVTVSENIAFLRQQVNACLQTPQSSGIDMNVKLLDGAILIEVMGYFVNVLSGDEDASREQKVSYLGEHRGVTGFMQECISVSLHLHDALVSFVPDDPEVQTIAGDLVQSAVELYDSLGALSEHRGQECGIDTIFQVTKRTNGDSGCHTLDLQIWLVKLINCRCIVTLQECSANSMLALGDDLKAIGELVECDSDNTLRSKSRFINDVLELLSISKLDEHGLDLLLERQSRSIALTLESDNIANKDVVVNTDIIMKSEDSNVNISAPLYHQARTIYEAALRIYYTKASEDANVKCDKEEEEEEEEEPDNISAIHYNLLCILWKIKETDLNNISLLLQEHLKSYLIIEIETACGDDDEHDHNHDKARITNSILQQVISDTDLEGISKSEWWAEVLHELHIHEFVTS